MSLICPTASLTPTNNAHRIWFRLWTHLHWLHSCWCEETPNPACFSWYRQQCYPK